MAKEDQVEHEGDGAAHGREGEPEGTGRARRRGGGQGLACTGSGAQTKQALVLGLLQRKQGAEVSQSSSRRRARSSTRAALTRLRQGGHDLQKEKRTGALPGLRAIAGARRGD